MAAFYDQSFSTSGFSVTAFDFGATPPAPDVLHGGHFGFDEKTRRKRWDSELSAEEERKRILREAFYGLPVEVREEITAQPEQAIDVAAETVLDYTKMLRQIEELARRINQYGVDKLDQQDDDDMLELIAMGVL